MYFLVNASSLKQLDIATSNFAVAFDWLDQKRVFAMIFAMVYHRLKSSCILGLSLCLSTGVKSGKFRQRP